MSLMNISATAVLAFAMSTGISFADSHGNEYVHSRTSGGQIFIMYQNHMSLYTYEHDMLGVSNCYGECAEAWPPAILDADTMLGESYSLIKRDDGKMQAAFKDQPLYLSVLDGKIGDTNGDGIGGVWYLARPDF
jgi:predicted lipoprotein with Yx(FWY)xxD motif